MAPDAQFSREGINNSLNYRIPLKIKSTVSYHMQYKKQTLLTTATCLLKRETTSGIKICIVCANRSYYEIGLRLPSFSNVANKNNFNHN